MTPLQEAAYVAGICIACAGYVGFLLWDFRRSWKQFHREGEIYRSETAKQDYLKEYGPQIMFEASETGNIEYIRPWE